MKTDEECLEFLSRRNMIGFNAASHESGLAKSTACRMLRKAKKITDDKSIPKNMQVKYTAEYCQKILGDKAMMGWESARRKNGLTQGQFHYAITKAKKVSSHGNL